MSSLRQKSAPKFVPSSILLDRRWKDHDYQLHTYRLKTLQGQNASFPKYPALSPRSARRLEQAAKYNPPPEKAPKMTVERHTKSAKTERRRIDVYVRPTGSAFSGTKSRPQSNIKTPITTARSNAMSTPGRRELSPPQRNKWVQPTTRRSDYSLSAQNDHWKRHLYYRNVILGRRVKKSPRKIKTPEPEPESSSSEEEIEEEGDTPNDPSIPHSASPPDPPKKEPTPEPDDTMELSEDEDAEARRSKTPVLIRPRSSINSKNFIPPSRILKIVRDAEPSSDSSWDDSDSEGGPQLILRDGKPGQRYVLRGKKKHRRSSSDFEGSESSSDDDMVLTNQYLKKPETPDALMDAKDDQSSSENYDEFGRLRKRYKRPESAVEEILPPMVMDPSDFGDVNVTKARLQKDTLVIREELVKEEGPDLELVVDTIIGHNNTNRRWIRKLYRQEYLESLMTQVRKLLPADIASVVSYMMLPPAEYDAMCLHDSMKGLQKEPEVLIEILCTRDNEEIEGIKSYYRRRYAEDLLDDLEDETTGSFQRMLLTLAVGKRGKDEGEPDREAANAIAKALIAILAVGGDQMDRKFTDVFGKLGFPTLRKVLSEYRKIKHHDIENEIINNFTGNLRRCLLTIVQYIQNPPGYFVEKLHATHYGGLDDDKTLSRIIISRQDRDYKMIKELFKLRYDMELFDYIKNTCHSTERGLVLRLIAGQLPGEIRRQLVAKLPKLVVPSELVSFNKRLSLNDAITIILRKIQVSSTLVKVLNVRRERIAKLEEESVVELELDYEEEEEIEEPKERDPGNENSDGEGGGKEAQEELRNNLKNLDFKDAAGDGEDGKKRSALASVSFSTAARGMNKQENRVKFKTDEDGSENESGSASGSNRRGSVQAALPAPVQDPSFLGRRDSNFFEKVVPFIKGRRKKYYRGTIKGIPMEDFNALKDAQTVGRALLQKNRNIEGIIKFIISRNNAQRQLIVREFFRRYRRDLVDDLRYLTGPEMEDFILGLMLAPEVYDSSGIFEVWSAKKQAGEEDENSEEQNDTITEILCTRGNDEINVIKRAYQGIFGRDVQDDLESVTSGWLRILFNRVLKCDRDEGDVVDDKLAQKDANKLFEAHSRKSHDYDVYIDILTSRSQSHLNVVFKHFAAITGSDILEYLEEDMSGDFLEALTAIICNSRDASMYFCERIYQAMALHPMDDKSLVRCILTRAEIDLNDIKATFRRTYGRSLYNMVEKECSGKYRLFLLDVIGKGNQGKKKRSKLWNLIAPK